MKENLRTTLRCTGVALVVIAALLVAPIASAHQDPTGATATGVSLALTAFRADGVTPVLPGNIFQCETIIYQATLCYNTSTQLGINAAFEGGELYIQLPGTPLPPRTLVAGGSVSTIPCLGGNDVGEGCDPAVDCVTSPPLTFTATVTDCDGADGGTLVANAIYENGIAHIDADEQIGIGGTNPFPVDVVCCLQDGDVCNGAEFCDPTVVFDVDLAGLGTFRQGTCADGPNAVESTVCTDTDGNLCTTAGCDFATGLCDQAHVPVVCNDDGNLCNGVEVCDPLTGGCDAPNAPESTICPDTDGNLCTTAGCDFLTGACDQAHVPVECVDPICTACVPLTGDCEPIVPVPDACVDGDEICRTPGFWGTHGGIEKDSSTNITGTLLDAYNDPGPDLIFGTPDDVQVLEICGTPITNTDLGSQNSALEAICVSPKGDSRLQLARQLTAAALNCIITKSTDADGACTTAGLTGDICGGVSIEDFFNDCNAACAADETTIDHDSDPLTAPVSCIGLLDCFNNGGVILADGSCDEGEFPTCHDRALCADFVPPGAAGSPRECNDSRKNCVTIFGPLPDCP